MAIDKKLRIFDNQGNEQDYDIMATDVKFLPDGKDLPTKLAEMEQEIGEAGQVNEIIMNGQPYTPTNKVIDLGTVIMQHQDISGKVDKETGKGLSTNDFTNELLTKLNGLSNYNDTALQTAVSNLQTALQNVYTKSQTYSKSEVDAAVAESGKVKSVSINDGEPVEPDANGNVELEIEAGHGADGVTPHIDQVTGHWFIGETDTNVSAQGPQGNSGVASGDDVVVVNNLDGEPDNLEQGQVAVLSAEMGKELGLGILAGGGTFADAFDRSKEDNVVFPWLMRDVDSNGDDITKMIWHVGNNKFVDAIGAEINGVKNGLTVAADGEGSLSLTPDINDAQSFSVPFSKGETNYSFDEIAELANTANYNGQSFKDFSVSKGTTTEIEIDFGGMRWKGTYFLFGAPSNITSIKRLSADWFKGSGAFNGFMNISSADAPNAKLKYFQLIGNYTGSNFGGIKNQNALRVVDFSQVNAPNITSLNGFLSVEGNIELTLVDIRTLDTTNVTDFAGFLFKRQIGTMIIGNFTVNQNATMTNMLRYTTISTLVCTTETPPDLSYDWLSSRVSSIKIPNKTVEVNGEQVSLLSVYQNHVQSGGTVGESGWSKYASIMTTYEEGEY